MDEVAAAFREALCGPRHRDSPEVAWTDGGAQILLHVGTVRAVVTGSTLIVTVDTECAEFGVAPLIVRFAFGTEGGPASLIAATDATALGHPQVAARWGDLFREVVWAAFARLLEVHGNGMAPTAITVGPDQLRIAYEKSPSVVGLAEEHLRERVHRGLRPPPLVRRDTGAAG